MSTAEHQRVKEVFLEVCDAAPSDRPGLLDRACAGNTGLRRAVERMLASDSDPAGIDSGAAVRSEIEALLDEHASGSAAEPTGPVAHPTQIGVYRIEGVLGEGGFGTVYRAEQTHPLRRPVALKIIKRGMDTRQVVARFAAERQTLALMDHPAIARVFDAGETEAGQPYFAMELVAGPPITEFCDTRRMPVRERLGLFISVCAAVQHAHQKGVIHRDIKPTNILVELKDDDAAPKLIDFGIARAVADAQHAGPQLTREGQLIGTPDYVSPEQASGSLDIDTRSDIYSLGVLLYKLLTGVTPFERRTLVPAGQGPAPDPPTPSTRLRELGQARVAAAAQRNTDYATLRNLLRGDLDCIVTKAVAADRELRYESVHALAGDVARYLRDEPIAARPPSTAYRFRKFARRHRLALAAGGTMLILLIAGIVGTTIGLVQARHSAVVARTESAIARAVTEFLTTDLLSAPTPEQQGKDVTVRAVVDAAAKRIDGRFPDQPLVEAGVRLAIGETYLTLAEHAAAEDQLVPAFESRRQFLGPDHPDTLNAARAVGRLRSDQARLDEAEALFTDTLERGRRVQGPTHRYVFADAIQLARTYERHGRSSDAERAYRALLKEQVAALGNDHSDVLAVRSNLVRILLRRGQFDEVRPLLLETLASQERTHGAEHPHTLFTRNSLALLEQQSGRLQEAETAYLSLLEMMGRVWGDDHPNTLFVMGEFALVYQKQNRLHDAERLRVTVVEGLERALGADHPETQIASEQLGDIYFLQHRWDEAEWRYEPVLDTNRQRFGPLHAYTRESQLRLARTYARQNRLAEAERLWIPLIDFASDACDPKLREYQMEYGIVLASMSRPAEAEASLRDAAGEPTESGGRGPFIRSQALDALIAFYEANDRAAEGAALRAEQRVSKD